MISINLFQNTFKSFSNRFQSILVRQFIKVEFTFLAHKFVYNWLKLHLMLIRKKWSKF